MHLLVYNSSVLDIVTSNKMQLPKFIVWKARGRISLAFIDETDIPPCPYEEIIPILFRDARFEYRPEHRPSLRRVSFVFFRLCRINVKVPMTILSHYRTQCAKNYTMFSSCRHPYSCFFTFDELYLPECTVDSGLSGTFLWISIRNWIIAVVLRKIQSFTLQTHYNYQLFATHGFPSGPF